MADSTWGVPLWGEAMWGETPAGPAPPPPIPVDPSTAYVTFRVSVGEPPTVAEVQIQIAH